MNAPWVHYHIVTLFPEYFSGPLTVGLMGKAAEQGIIRFTIYDLRSFTPLKHQQVDDEAFGGGPGMVLRIEPLVASFRAITQTLEPDSYQVIAFNPSGSSFDQPMANQMAQTIKFSKLKHVLLYCGRYEGFDERFLESYVHQRIRVADVVYLGGEAAAMIFCEAISRLLPGVVGNPDSLKFEYYTQSQFDYPVYTRPRSFEGLEVPEVLFSGDHAKIEAWRNEAAERLAQKYRSGH
jgi:tRNA (guanine37-N1)-methyltransferase